MRSKHGDVYALQHFGDLERVLGVDVEPSDRPRGLLGTVNVLSAQYQL